DDVGAQVRQAHGRERRGDVLAEVEHTQPAERGGHARPSASHAARTESAQARADRLRRYARCSGNSRVKPSAPVTCIQIATARSDASPAWARASAPGQSPA